MKQTVNFCDFQDAFYKMDRKDNFTYEGKRALFNWLEEYEEDYGEEIELDVIALCCEYTEYSDIEEFWKDYDKEEYPTIEDIGDNTVVITVNDDAFIIQCF